MLTKMRRSFRSGKALAMVGSGEVIAAVYLPALV